MNLYTCAHPCYMRPHDVFGVERQPFDLNWWNVRHGYGIRDKAWMFWSLPTVSEVFWGRARGVNRAALAQADAQDGPQ